MDEDSIRAGQLWPGRIESAIVEAKVVLVLIGRRWLAIADAFGRRRIDDEHDWVHKEIALALSREIPIVPLPVAGNTTMPRAEALPVPPAKLATSQRNILHDDGWGNALDSFIDGLIADHGIPDSETKLPELPRPSGKKRHEAELTEAQLDEKLRDLPGWEPVESDIPGRYPSRTRQELRRTFVFTSFDAAIDFMTAAAPLLEKMQHHPRWENQHRTVTVWFSTWAINHRISDWDIRAAHQLNELYASLTR